MRHYMEVQKMSKRFVYTPLTAMPSGNYWHVSAESSAAIFRRLRVCPKHRRQDSFFSSEDSLRPQRYCQRDVHTFQHTKHSQLYPRPQHLYAILLERNTQTCALSILHDYNPYPAKAKILRRNKGHSQLPTKFLYFFVSIACRSTAVFFMEGEGPQMQGLEEHIIDPNNTANDHIGHNENT